MMTLGSLPLLVGCLSLFAGAAAALAAPATPGAASITVPHLQGIFVSLDNTTASRARVGGGWALWLGGGLAWGIFVSMAVFRTLNYGKLR